MRYLTALANEVSNLRKQVLLHEKRLDSAEGKTRELNVLVHDELVAQPAVPAEEVSEFKKELNAMKEFLMKANPHSANMFKPTEHGGSNVIGDSRNVFRTHEQGGVNAPVFQPPGISQNLFGPTAKPLKTGSREAGPAHGDAVNT